MRLLQLFMISACLLSASAHAQLRTIPGEAKGGELRHAQDGASLSIGGVALRLAPGAQIRDESNRLVVPTAVPAGAQVKYLLNDEGQVRQVWILTPAEAAKREKVKNEALKN
jgi:hypothetical protein